MAESRTKRQRGAARATALLQQSDFVSYLREKSEQLAPADVRSLLGKAELVHTCVARQCSERPRLQRQAELALRILADHAAEQCPQIPYYTISLLTVALLYLIDPVDVIPDWLPGVGSSDDALVFELAFQIGRPGIERYCAWKGLATDGVLAPPPKPAAPPRIAPKRMAAKPRRTTRRAPKPGRSRAR